MRHSYGRHAVGLALLATSVAGLTVATGGARKARTVKLTTAAGHPVAGMPLPFDARVPDILSMAGQSDATPPNEVVIPPLSPLESGEYVNFESPPVQPLAMFAGTVLVTNTPAGTLDVLETNAVDGTKLILKTSTPVGIDPVAVAVEPGGSFAWVSNYVSDSISVVDLGTGEVVDVLEAGDEPSTIAFSADGTTAYVVFEGAAPTVDNELIEPSPALGVYDVGTRQLLTWVELPADTPRGMVYDPATAQIFVAALRSGNNTTVVGEPLVHTFLNGDFELRPALQVVRDFSVTASAFAASSFAPYPPVSAEPGAPETQLILADDDAEWQRILDLLRTPDGLPDPAVVSQYAAENSMSFEDAEFVIAGVLNDVKDTLDNDVIVLDASVPSAPVIDRVISNVGTILTTLEKRPGTDEIYAANLEALNTIRHEPNLNGHFFDHELVVFANNGVSPPQRFDLNAGISGFNTPGAAAPNAFADSLSNPIDIAFTPNGSRLLVAALGSSRVGMLDPVSMSVLDRVDVGRGTRGLIVDDQGRRAYTYNRTDNSVTAIDLSADAMHVSDTLKLFNPEPAEVVEGRNFLYSTEFSFNNASSCAMCHVDGHLDGLAWDLGDPAGALQPAPSNVVDPDTGEPLMNHPAKGPMVTMSLRGLRDHNAYHWRGDKPMFEDFNGAFASLLGGAELPAEDMVKYRRFIDTVVYPPNPFYDRDNSFKDPRAVNGAGIYLQNCQVCHSLFDDGTLRLAGFEDDTGMELFSLFAQIQEITQLRGIHRKFDMDLYSGFGLIHDGREEREDNAHPINTFLNTFFRNIVGTQQDELIAFLNAFQTNVMPIVGWDVRYDQLTTAQGQSDIDLMILRAEPLAGFSNQAVCDVIARGEINGQKVGYVFKSRTPDVPSGIGTVPGNTGRGQISGNGVAHAGGPGQNTPPIADNTVFLDDTGGSITLSDLLNLAAQPGNFLHFIAVPPGSGVRLGIDADGDSLLNGLDPFAMQSPDVNKDGVIDAVDLTAYLDLYNNADPDADYDGNRIINSDDLDAYLFEYTAATS